MNINGVAKPNVFVTSGIPNDYQTLYTATNFKHSYRFSLFSTVQVLMTDNR